jgi:hypothetical protein
VEPPGVVKQLEQPVGSITAKLTAHEVKRRDLADVRALGQPAGWHPLDAELTHDQLDRVVTDIDDATVLELGVTRCAP